MAESDELRVSTPSASWAIGGESLLAIVAKTELIEYYL